jgi:hypothetical protein
LPEAVLLGVVGGAFQLLSLASQPTSQPAAVVAVAVAAVTLKMNSRSCASRQLGQVSHWKSLINAQVLFSTLDNFPQGYDSVVLFRVGFKPSFNLPG